MKYSVVEEAVWDGRVPGFNTLRETRGDSGYIEPIIVERMRVCAYAFSSPKRLGCASADSKDRSGTAFVCHCGTLIVERARTLERIPQVHMALLVRVTLVHSVAHTRLRRTIDLISLHAYTSPSPLVDISLPAAHIRIRLDADATMASSLRHTLLLTIVFRCARGAAIRLEFRSYSTKLVGV